MKLIAIEVRGWQCFADPCVLADFGPGLNVVHAPNGTGKSTLFAALRRGLFDRFATGGAEIEALRPWGRKLAPRVTITFEHAGVRYRIEKQFLDRPSAMLAREENGQFRSFAEAEHADDALRQMFRAAPPGRGATRGPEHWGVAGAGWVPQGALEATTIEPTLAALVRATLGAEAVGGPGGDAIERAVESRYAEHFTAGGKFKTGANASRVVAARAAVEELAARRAALLPKVEAFEAASRRVDDCRLARENARRGEAETAARRDALRAAVEKRAGVEQAMREQEIAEQSARAAHDRLRRDIAQIAEARAASTTAAAERAKLEAAGPTLAAAAADARRALDAAAAALALARAGRESVATLASDAEAAESLARATRETVTLSERLARAEAAETAIADLGRRADALIAPAAKTLKSIRAAIGERDVARARLEASMITLRIEPTRLATIDARVAERPGAVDVAAGAAAVVRGSPEVVVAIDGLGVVRASGPAVESIDALRAALADAASRIAKLVAPFGTDDLDELQRRADADAELRVAISRAEAQRDAALGDDEPHELARSLAQAERARDAALAAHPDWRGASPDPKALRIAADDAARAQRRAEDDAAAAHARGAETSARADAAAGTHAARLDAARRRATELADAAARLAAADGLDDAQRSARADDAALAWRAATAALARARDALAAMGEDPAPALADAERSLAALAAEADATRDAQRLAEGRLGELADAGAYSQLNDVDEALAQAREELAAAEAEAAALLLLRETVRAERERLVRGVAGPVEAIVDATLRRVAGARLGAVRLDASFAPSHLDGADATTIDLAALSGGEREQVHLAVRLALAEVLAGADGGVRLAVLDDALVNTDAGRLGRYRAVLEEFAQRLQIVVFTCHPERYRDLAGAKTFDLERLRAAE